MPNIHNFQDASCVMWSGRPWLDNIIRNLTIFMIFMSTPQTTATQVKVDSSVPAVLKPIKPKFYVLGTVSLKDGCAVRLK